MSSIFDIKTWLVLTTSSFVIYGLTLAIYRLYFHPLSHFPGPKLTAATYWIDCYYEIIRQGRFMWEIDKMHARYGPIVRINPDELHIKDDDIDAYVGEIYGSSTKPRNKYKGSTVMVGFTGSSIATVDWKVHRLRRGPLNPFFSKKAVASNTEELIRGNVDKLLAKLDGALTTKEVVGVDVWFIALSMNVICQYAYGWDDVDYLADDEEAALWKDILITSVQSGGFMRHFPWVFPLIPMIPHGMLKMMNRGLWTTLDWRKATHHRIERIMNDEGDTKGQRSMFHEVRDSDLPPEQKTTMRLVDEGQIFLGAGSETTARVLSYLTFYLLNDSGKLSKLRAELKTVMPDDEVPSWSRLEQLPYLSAVISEGLRLSHGVTTRLPRVAVGEPFQYKGWKIPLETPVSTSAYFTLMNPNIFPDPTNFTPERWILPNGKYDYTKNKYIVNFGKGPRQCIGINLAYAEMYIATAAVFSRFDMELFETTVEDVTMVHDYFIGMPKLSSKGIRVVVKGRVK